MDARSVVLDAVRAELPQGPLLVALSGGADSAVAAWAVLQIVGVESVRLVHVDHGLPGSEIMRAAANFVADHLGMALRVMSIDISGSGSEETRARIMRLAALESCAEPGEWIVTGHHRDDAAETVLGNLLRGAGATGLAGIASHRDRYVRPLLEVPGDVVRRLADELAIPYRDDPANDDLRHRRNVLRQRVMPELEAGLGIDVRGALYRTAHILSADDAVLEAQAEVVPIRFEDGAALLPAATLVTLPRPVAARAVRRGIRGARPPYPGSASEVAAVLDVARDGGRRQLLSGWHAVREGAMVVIVPALEMAPVEPAALRLPGSVIFGHSHRIKGELLEEGPKARPIGRARALLDPAVVGSALEVRSPLPGERLELSDGSKTVRDALSEAGVPVRHRGTWPVVAVHGRIAWIAGVRMAAWAEAEHGPGPVIVMGWERNTGEGRSGTDLG